MPNVARVLSLLQRQALDLGRPCATAYFFLGRPGHATIAGRIPAGIEHFTVMSPVNAVHLNYALIIVLKLKPKYRDDSSAQKFNPNCGKCEVETPLNTVPFRVSNFMPY
jgi:hypothetical protein